MQTRPIQAVPFRPSRSSKAIEENRADYGRFGPLFAAIAVAVLVARVGEYLGPLRAARPVLLVVSAALLYHFAATSQRVWIVLLRSSQFRLILLYFITIVLSAPSSIWRGRSVEILMSLPWALALVAIVGIVTPSIRALDIALRGLVFGAATAALAAIAQGEVVEGSRLTSLGSYDPNDLALLFSIALPVAIGASTRGRVAHRVSNFSAAIVLSYALLQTGSRGGLIALGVGALTMLASMKLSRIVIVAGGLAVLLPLGWNFAPPVMRERAASLLELSEDYNTTSNSGRLYLWQRGMVFALENPVFGVGAGTFEARIGTDFEQQGSRGAWHTAHNTVVQAFAELGVLGGMLLLALLANAARVYFRFWSVKTRARRPELLASLLAFTAAIMFLSEAYTYLLWGTFAFSVLAESVSGGARRSLRTARPLKVNPAAPRRYQHRVGAAVV